MRRFGVQARTRIMNQLQARATGHITGKGSSMLHFLMVEAAQVTVRSLPESRSKCLQHPPCTCPQHPQPESWLSLAGKRVVDEPRKNTGVQKQFEVVHQCAKQVAEKLRLLAFLWKSGPFRAA